MATALLDTEIKYNRANHDYDILIAGIAVASAPDYRKAEAKRTQLLAERRDEGLYASASELDDGDPFADPRSDEERQAEEEKWKPCKGGWECFLLDPFGSGKIIRHFQPRLFDGPGDVPYPDEPTPTNESDDPDALPNPGRAIARQFHHHPRQFIAVLRQLDPATWLPLATAYAEWRGTTAEAVLDIWMMAVQGTAKVPANARPY
jgi:hypothetical protein